MSDMICNICGKYGIYWKNLHTNNPITYCPYCNKYNCHKIPELEENEED